MMKVYTTNGVAHITVGNSEYNIPENLKGLIDNNELLEQLTMQELVELLKTHIGIPANFKDFLIKKAKLYGDSLEVSSFICEGNKVWLDKQQRSSILNLLNLSSNKLEDDFELVLHDKIHTIAKNKLIDLISNLEIFSYKCLVNTIKHLEAINKLKTLKEIVEYDYTSNYPEKIILE